MGCFWTDLVGVSQECPAPAVAMSAFGASAPSLFQSTVDLWFGRNASGGCWYTGKSVQVGDGGYGDPENPYAIVLTSAYVKRIDSVLATDSGCDYADGAPPAWFPADAAACGVLTTPHPGATSSVDNLNLALAPYDNGGGPNIPGDPTMTADLDALWSAAGQAGKVNGILYLEIVGNDGGHYFGTVATSSCF